MDKQIILASGSPRRKELMTLAGYTFEVKVSEKEEHYKSNVPEEIVKELALQKAEDVAERTREEETNALGQTLLWQWIRRFSGNQRQKKKLLP